MDVVILKMDALSFDRNNEAYVYMKEESEELKQVKVTLGVSNDNYVEIKSGLQEGDTVYVEAKAEETATGFAALFGTRNQFNQERGNRGNYGNNGGNMPDAVGVPEEQLRAVLDQLLEVAARNGVDGRLPVEGPAPVEPAEPEETEVEREAREAIERGDWAAAEAVYDHAIANSPADDDLKAARNQVRMLARMDGEDPAALLAAADAPGADLDAQLAGADAALALGDVNACLRRALEAVRAHTGEERERARVRVLELFEVIGATAPEVARARRQLATILY